MKIPFNKPNIIGKELEYIKEAVDSGKISGNGIFTKKCQKFFEEQLGVAKCLLTTSCTDALEMAAILCDIQPGDEVILPSYTFVSTANAFLLRGAVIKLVDSESDNPNMSIEAIRQEITSKTKVIVVVHYAGVACDMDEVMAVAEKNNLLVVEDAAQAIDSRYKGRPLGSIGHLGAFSFHETKNIIAGEGGLLTINDPRFADRAEIIWEKGTNRSAFFRGEIDKYTWVDVGSSFLPSELVAAFLYAQLENLEKIQSRRKAIWEQYNKGLQHLSDSGLIQLPQIPEYAENNGHLFYLLCENLETRSRLIQYLKTQGILAVFHYIPLHLPAFYSKSNPLTLPNAERFGETLLRLPLFYNLSDTEIQTIISAINTFFKHEKESLQKATKESLFH